jgi:anti-sigma-K factor RskA
MSGLKRYQNPEVFERLAMDYAVGMMKGRAKKRYEALMKQHFYLRAVTEAYENKLASLTAFLPEKAPPAHVWKNIQKELNLKTTKEKAKKNTGLFAWWHTLGAQVAGLIASLSLLFGMGFSLLSSSLAGADGYVAVMESMDTHKPMVMAKAKKGEGLYIKFMEESHMPENMSMKLWCIPKSGGKPMMMGDVNENEVWVKLDKSTWRGLADVGKLAISLEHKDMQAETPQGEIMYAGELMVMEENK